MSDYLLVQQRMNEAVARRGLSRMDAIQRLTKAAITEVSAVHRYTIDAAQRTVAEAEQIQCAAGKSLDEPHFQQLTADYLSHLTSITEAAGANMLRLIDRTFR
jgi:hypothetical protein